jgi:hypothetical protein
MDLLRHDRRLTPRRLAPGAALLALTACMPAGVTVDPGQPIGPTLVIDITNRSDAERTIGYEFDMGSMSGGGEGTLLACERSVMPFGEIGSNFTILVDSEPVIEETLPPGIPPDRFVVVKVTVAEDGTATAAAPVLAARMPPVQSAPIPGCG